MLKEHVVEFLNQLTLPTLIIYGLKDEFIPNRLIHPMETTKNVAEKGKALIKDSEFRLIDGAGHFVHIEKYEEVNEEMITFLKE